MVFVARVTRVHSHLRVSACPFAELRHDFPRRFSLAWLVLKVQNPVVVDRDFFCEKLYMRSFSFMFAVLIFGSPETNNDMTFVICIFIGLELEAENLCVENIVV